MSDLSKITCIEDLRQVYLRKVPTMFVDYCESGSYTESTFRANQEDFRKLLFRQKVARDLSNRTVATQMIGQDVAMPVAIAPTGLAGMQHADGEILGAKAAEEFGVPFILSTMSVCSIEDVAQHTNKPFWFQLYVMRDMDFIRRLIDRAKAANCSALMITLDLQILGQRHKDIKNGLSTPPKPTLKNILNLATKPEWCFAMSKTKRRYMGNIVGHASNVSDMRSLSAWTVEQFDPQLNWDSVKEIMDYWGGKVIIKGIMETDDAIKAAEIGADAIVVSNHGGRQLDGAPSSISVLPEIIQAVRQAGHNTEIWVDGGVRQGQDVLRARALGAQGVLIGRPYLYGLGAYGQEGVYKALELIQKELDISMAFCGHTDINQVDSHILRNPELYAPKPQTDKQGANTDAQTDVKEPQTEDKGGKDVKKS
ncbi:alpha-hydroxy acid oxidase [Brackiella oedipodis]|uniref:alpha-hydroxy acid oxidase n=1 Tax=Brackiella oedipodis TaxID=124225 RepID=UPI0009FE48B8|nr:alpha-hydroxy acid oxidase [Brackiella oedipodis]